MPLEEYEEIERITKEASVNIDNNVKPFPPWSNYEKYLNGITMDTGERPLIPVDPYHRDPKTHVPYHTWLDARKEEIKFAEWFEDTP